MWAMWQRRRAGLWTSEWVSAFHLVGLVGVWASSSAQSYGHSSLQCFLRQALSAAGMSIHSYYPCLIQKHIYCNVVNIHKKSLKTPLTPTLTRKCSLRVLLHGCVYEHAHLSVSILVYEHKSTSRAAVYTLYLCGCTGWNLTQPGCPEPGSCTHKALV